MVLVTMASVLTGVVRVKWIAVRASCPSPPAAKVLVPRSSYERTYAKHRCFPDTSNESNRCLSIRGVQRLAGFSAAKLRADRLSLLMKSAEIQDHLLRTGVQSAWIGVRSKIFR